MFLEKIITHKVKEVAGRKEQRPLASLVRQLPPIQDQRGKFRRALEKPGISLIAEVKKASPSRGVLCPDFEPVRIATSYERNGADAVSVLTDTTFFQGSHAYLQQIREAVGLPLLCKDFIIDAYQVYEAVVYGADAVLLIAAVLEEKELVSFLHLAHGLGLAVLVEVHSRQELKRALGAGAEIIGINNRDLRTFRTDLRTTLQLAALAPDSCLLVSESGIKSAGDLKLLAEAGVDAVLIGEALMSSTDPGQKLRELAGG